MTLSAVTLEGTSAPLGDEAVEELKGRIRGSVATPSDPAFADLNPVFNAMHDGRPAIAVRCSGTADVADAVRFATAHGLVTAVRGGGHSIAGLSTAEGGLLVDLSGMRGVQVDPVRRLAHVQGGATWGDLDREAQVFGLATPGGVVSDTGVGGLTLGGGYGWLRRKHGLACDNLVEAQVVCADGQVRTASANEHPDLYWAIRGGGGNFGVVTSFTFRLHPVGPMVAFAGVFYPVEEVAQVLRGYRDYTAGAPDEVSSIAVVFTFPGGHGMPPQVEDRPVTIVGAVHSGDVETGMGVLQPLRELGTPLFDLSQPMPFTAVQSAFDPLLPKQLYRSYWKSQYLDELSDGAIDAFVGLALDRPEPLCVMNVWHMGGAVNRVGPEETAFAERTADYMVSIDGNWTDPARDDAVIGWARSAWARMGEHGTGAVYLNFTGLSGEEASAGVDSALGRNLRRLSAVKATYDPANFFRRNNNISPGGDA